MASSSLAIQVFNHSGPYCFFCSERLTLRDMEVHHLRLGYFLSRHFPGLEFIGCECAHQACHRRHHEKMRAIKDFVEKQNGGTIDFSLN